LQGWTALGLALLFGACGEDELAGPTPVEPGTLLEALAERVASGRGISDDSWTREVQEVGLALWPDQPGEGAPLSQAARQTHTHLAHIAGDMAVQLGGPAGAEARRSWGESDPLSVDIHDEFLTAAAGGAGAYRLWVEGSGGDLLRRRVEALGGR
jgi:hypothetical protein